MFKGFALALAGLAAAVLVGTALASGSTVYHQTKGYAPSDAPKIDYAKISNTQSTITFAVWLANRAKGTNVGDMIKIGLNVDNTSKVDYHLYYTKDSKGASTSVFEWNGKEYAYDAAATKAMKVTYFGAKGTYFAMTFPRSKLRIGKSFDFWVETEYFCTDKAGSCHAGEFLPRTTKPGFLVYNVK